MERESELKGETQPFVGGDYLSSPTSAEEGMWNSAEGVTLSLGAAMRMFGKSIVGQADSAVLGFSQIGNLVIVQFASHVSAFGPIFFGVTQNITDQNDNPIQTEDSETLTT